MEEEEGHDGAKESVAVSLARIGRASDYTAVTEMARRG